MNSSARWGAARGGRGVWRARWGAGCARARWGAARGAGCAAGCGFGVCGAGRRCVPRQCRYARNPVQWWTTPRAVSSIGIPQGLTAARVRRLWQVRGESFVNPGPVAAPPRPGPAPVPKSRQRFLCLFGRFKHFFPCLVCEAPLAPPREAPAAHTPRPARLSADAHPSPCPRGSR